MSEEASEKRIRQLIRLLTDQDSRTRSAAAAALGEFKNDCIVEPLMAALDDPDPYVRGNAAVSLMQGRENADVLEPLANALSDVSPKVREKAIWALQNLRDERYQVDERAAEPLVAALNDENAGV